MRTIQYVRAGCLVSTFAACLLMAGSARADQSSERPGSLLIFPKVVQAGGRETTIQITNTGNSVDNLHCFYINGADGSNGQPLCAVTDFFVTLTKQQPTHWDVSTGRPVNPNDSIEGLDPGIVPPVGPGFTGALVCVEVDADNAPVAMNKIKGEATLEGPSADISKYNGVAFQGATSGGTSDNILQLNPNGVEYDACRTASIFNFVPDSATDPVIEALGDGGTCGTGSTTPGSPCNNSSQCGGTGTCTTGQSRVVSAITVLPCNLDLQTQAPTKFKLGYEIYDQNESPFSTSSGALSCWASINLSDIGRQVTSASNGGALFGPYATMRITGTTGGPVIVVGESFHADAGSNIAAAAVNTQTTGLCQATGAQAPDITLTCQSVADCPNTTGYTCVTSQPSQIKLPTLLE